MTAACTPRAGKGFRLGGATTPNTNAVCLEGLALLGINSAPTFIRPGSVVEL